MLPPITTRLLLQNTARSPLGRITMAGYIKDSTGLRESPMRILGSYALLYLLEGAGRYRDVSNSADVKAGNLLLLFPDIGHTYGPGKGQKWSEFYIVFDGPVFDLWRREGLISPSRPIFHLEPMHYWLRRLEETVQGPAEWRQGTPPEKICLLQHVLADVLELSRQNEDHRNQNAWVEEACGRLRALADDADIEQVAADLGMSYENFRKRFTRLMGVPPMRYRMQCVIDEVCHALQREELPLRTVARRFGFCDEFHLSRRFKQIMGVSPAAFRRQLGIE